MEREESQSSKGIKAEYRIIQAGIGKTKKQNTAAD